MDPDYYKKAPESPHMELKETYLSGPHFPYPQIVALLSVALIGLFSNIYWFNLKGIGEFLYASNELTFGKGEYWRFFTAMFIHADIIHFLSNSYMLLFWSYLNYGHFGTWVFPFGAVIFGALTNAWAIWTYPPGTVLLGASGLVYLLGGLWLTQYIFLERQHHFFNRVVRAFGVAFVVYFPSSFSPEISYRTHFIGLIMGMALGGLTFILRKSYYRSFEKWVEVPTPPLPPEFEQEEERTIDDDRED